MWVWYEYNAPAAGDVHIDDCTLEVTGPAKSGARQARRALSRACARGLSRLAGGRR